MQESENQKTYEEDDEEEDNSFIKIVSRNHQMFSNRSSKFLHLDREGNLIVEELPTIPYEVIICDGCNSLIKDEEVGLLMLDEDQCWGTQCAKCVREFFAGLPIVREGNKL